VKYVKSLAGAVQGDKGQTSATSVRKYCFCNCTDRGLVAELEGIKLDLTILESRMPIANSQNKLESEINYLLVS
jgi:hypothetical protein